jgi:hypothetical protein
LAAVLSTLVVTTSLTVVLLPRPAAADQIADLKAQATAISQSLIQEQLQAGAYQLQYSVASQKVAADDRGIAQIGQQIGQNEQQIDKDTLAVRKLAIVSYMNGGSALSASDSLLFSGNEQAGQVADEYSVIAAGNIEDALDQLHSAQHTLQSHQSTLQEAQVQDESDQTQQATDLAQAEGTQHQMEFVQSQITGQLATAVAEQAATEAANAAAAVAAAQKAALAAAQKAALAAAEKAGAAAQKAGTGTATGVTAGRPTSVADPALNPYLQCVVDAESHRDYGAVSPNGMYMGAFQFSQATWNLAAGAAGLSALVGVPPNLASKAEQDAVAVALYALDGHQPWLGDRC